MFWRNKGQRHKKIETIDNLVGIDTEVQGDLCFAGVLHIDGTVKGNVIARETHDECVLALSESGVVEGEVHAPNVILNGTVHGDVHCPGYVELAPGARLLGDVHYHLLEMKVGAEVNGKLIHKLEKKPPQQAVKKEPSVTDSRREKT